MTFNIDDEAMTSEENAPPRSTALSGDGGHAVAGLLSKARKDQPWSDWLITSNLVGILAMLALSFRSDRWVESIAAGILVSGAALMTGAIAGFLFGIPRAAQDPTASSVKDSRFDAVYQVNTNLEQISDWLTKIIVGVGLIQISVIPARFMGIADYIATAFGSPPVPSSLVAASLLFLGLSGFLSSYLWTRLLLMLEFTKVDRAARQSEEFYEGFVQALLYQPGPQGFEAALEKGTEFIERFGEGNWRIWRSVACAWGQKFGYLQQLDSANADELGRSRKSALLAIKKIRYLAPRERQSIQGLWEPSATPEEDDLTVFYNEPEFRDFFADWASQPRG